ncbi:MAG TPA: metallophosphoesterase, partial [Candidatus Bilamarchaeaceae archaeon]|nr:metallophosphoesterase [Candidatus Bilamarchaeaceae archaeon]
MKILVFSDLHDDEEVTLEKIKEFYLSTKFDYVLIAGDTTSHSVSFVEEVVGLFSNCFIIPGNNEDAKVTEYLKNKEQYVHEKRVKI